MRGLREIGEKGLIREVLADYAMTACTDRIDDCVVIALSDVVGVEGLPYLVYSVDHPGLIDRPLPPGWQWRFRGRWAAACTSNDVLAMGARPVGFAIDLAMPGETAVSDIRDFYRGVTDVLDEYGATLEGGNIDANDRFETAAMCWGVVSPAGIIRRRGARPGDYVAVTTEIGLGWAAYVLRRQGRYHELSDDVRRALDEYNLLPLAPHRAIRETVEALPGAITSGMDLTDGLAEFVNTISEANGLGVLIDESSIPVTSALAECAALLRVPPCALAIEYGYDTPRAHGYTVDPARWEAVSSIYAKHETPLFRVGEVTTDTGLWWRFENGMTMPLPLLWYDPYRGGDIVERWLEVARELAGASRSA